MVGSIWSRDRYNPILNEYQEVALYQNVTTTLIKRGVKSSDNRKLCSYIIVWVRTIKPNLSLRERRIQKEQSLIWSLDAVNPMISRGCCDMRIVRIRPSLYLVIWIESHLFFDVRWRIFACNENNEKKMCLYFFSIRINLEEKKVDSSKHSLALYGCISVTIWMTNNA